MAAALSSTNPTDLPEELLHEVASYLGYADQVNLASTCRYLRLLRPREQAFPAFDLETRTCAGPTYHPVPILSRGLIAVRTLYPGPPNETWLQLIRDGEVIEVSNHQPSGTNEWSTKTIEVANHPIGTKAKKGDTLTIVNVNEMCRSITLAYKR